MAWSFYNTKGQRLTVGATGATGPSGAGSDPISTSYPSFTVGTYDDEFNDGSFSGWTLVNSGAHNPTITETNNVASFLMPGSDAGGEMHAYMKAYTAAVGDTVEICIGGGSGRSQNYNIAGVCMADGATYTAGTQVWWYWSPSEGAFTLARMTGYNGAASLGQYAYQAGAVVGHDIFLRLKYVSANNWRGYSSPDGISWVDITGDVGHTMTPTYIGFALTTWAGGLPFAWSIRYFKKLP